MWNLETEELIFYFHDKIENNDTDIVVVLVLQYGTSL